jgi:ATP-dependent exoDNAse (exonuclease V) beta subunit
MPKENTFLIYNASAGSGKTFTLVKTYLSILLKAKSTSYFKYILAITFTNKAASEMKSRILDALTQFSSTAILNNPTELFKQLCTELNQTSNQVHKKSIVILEDILHNYASFDISTIDGLTHKIIRSFAYDLKLPLNFEVELDSERVLNESVDRLIAKAGTDKALTKLLVDFAIEKADDDKSWDVSYDFNKISKLLTNENDLPFLKGLKDKTRQDFQLLKDGIGQKIIQVEHSISKKAETVLNLISESGLEFSDFLGGSKAYLPNYFLKLKNLSLDYDYNKAWIHNLEQKPLYPEKTTPEEIKTILDSIQPQIVLSFNETKDLFYLLKFLKSVYKNITPLSVLNEIQKEVIQLKAEENILLISEFNTLISNEIKGQPTPFIYERLGEKFKHFFIDEFQDTSLLQWQNLIPLLENALASENGSVMLVGDAKQAIYRWRGGKAEQFIDLYNKKTNPFQINPEIIPLNSNYRSFKEVIRFNNGFFKFLSSKVFSNPDYENLYTVANQIIESDNTGYVNLKFLEFDSESDKDEFYASEVHKTISNCLNNGFKFSDICVLVRKKKEGIAISEFLNKHGTSVMSSETLLLDNSPKVRFIINILKLIVQPENNELKIAVLSFLVEQNAIKNKHEFFKNSLSISKEKLFKSFEALGYFIDYNKLIQCSLFELVETLIRAFKLVPNSDAYVQYFMDEVLDFTRKRQADFSSFLEYYDSKKTKLSIVTPQGLDAVQIMTIHKSKGLEFPVVIFPYAELNIYAEKDPKEWFNLDSNTFNGFNHTLLNYSKQFEHFGDTGNTIYKKHQSELELDNLNLLYVALTRPIEQLFIISKKDISAKGTVNEITYSGFFINYLKHIGRWEDNTLNYSFGQEKKHGGEQEDTSTIIEELDYISVPKENHNIRIVTNSGYLWDTAQEKAIEKGNLIHHILSFIKTIDDIDIVIQNFTNDVSFNQNQILELESIVRDIVNHKQLAKYFNSKDIIYNERDIISQSGNIIRPDRLNINAKNEVIILDYKTGNEDPKHVAQLENYKNILKEMEFSVVKCILVYINEAIEVKEF